MLTTQIILCGVAFEVEVEYDLDRGDPDSNIADSVDLVKVYLLGYYPEGIDSRAAQKGDYVYLNVKSDLNYLTAKEQQTLENACWEHHRKMQEEAWDV